LKEISYRVLKVGEFNGDNPTVYYKVLCSCSEDRHTLTLELEHDCDSVNLSIEQELTWSSVWGDYSWYQRIWNRITGAIKLLFVGYIDVQGDCIIQGEEHIQSFIDALEEGKGFIKRWEKDRDIMLKKIKK